MPLNQKSPISLCEALIRCNCHNVIFLKYRLIAVNQNPKAEIAVFGNMLSADSNRLIGVLKKKAGMYFADAGAVKRKIDIFALVHAFIFFIND